jgi:hypothetical protein
MAFATVEPFGPIREDQRAGVVAAIIANVNRDSSAHPEPFTVDEFLPRYEGPEPEPATVDEDRLANKLRTWAMKMNQAAEPPKSELRPKKKE